MVLHHIAQRARDVVKLAALFHAQLLGDGDLHGLHKIFIPNRFQKHIAKAQRQHVLQAFFAEVVVNAINLFFFEKTRHIGVDGLRRG